MTLTDYKQRNVLLARGSNDTEYRSLPGGPTDKTKSILNGNPRDPERGIPIFSMYQGTAVDWEEGITDQNHVIAQFPYANHTAFLLDTIDVIVNSLAFDSIR